MSCKYNNCKHCGYKSECEIFKENAELKELKKKKEEIEIMTNFCKACKKMHTDNLTKAKEIIKRLLCVIRNHLCIADISFNVLINEAEKILKEE